MVIVELVESFAEVFDARPDGEYGGYDRGVDEREGDNFEHGPSEQDHLGEGADFSGPVWFDGDVVVQIVQNTDTRNDNDIPIWFTALMITWDILSLRVSVFCTI